MEKDKRKRDEPEEVNKHPRLDHFPVATHAMYVGDTTGMTRQQIVASKKKTKDVLVELGLGGHKPRVPDPIGGVDNQVLEKHPDFMVLNKDPVAQVTLDHVDMNSIRSMTTIEGTLLGKIHWMLENAGNEDVAFELEVLKTGYKGIVDMGFLTMQGLETVSSYKVAFRDIGMYEPVLKAWTQFTTDTPYEILKLSKEEALKYTAFIAKMSYEYTLSDGTLAGMLARIDACAKVAQACSKKSSMVDVLRDKYNKTVTEVTAEAWGVMDCDEPTFENIQMLASEVAMDMYAKSNLHSDAGLPYEKGTLREATWVSDQLSASALALVGPLTKESKEVITAINVTRCKPKFEITKASKRKTGTRNIKVMSAWLQVHAGMLLNRALRGNKTPLWSNRYGGAVETQSLYGFSPWHGGLDAVVNTMMARASKRKPYWAFYSDNVFAMSLDDDGYTFHSFDGEKMEASSRKDEGRLVIDYIMWHGAGIAPETDLGEWARFFCSDLAHDQISILGHSWFIQPGLGSGAQATFAINHGRMAWTCWALNHDHYDPCSVAIGENITGDYGAVLLKKEVDSTFAATPEYAKTVVPMMLSPKRPKYIPLTEIGKHPIERFGPIVRLDLLGHDACLKTRDGDLFFAACLTYERLMRALLYRDKTSLARKVDKFNSETVNVLIVMLVYIGYYYQGGYAYEDAHYIINATVLHLYSSNKATFVAIRSNPEVWQAAVEESADRMVAEGASQSNAAAAILGLANHVFKKMEELGLGSDVVPLSPDDEVMLAILYPAPLE